MNSPTLPLHDFRGEIRIGDIRLGSTFNFRDLRTAILAAAFDEASQCECCALAGVYNGRDSGPTLFHCPRGCHCHD